MSADNRPRITELEKELTAHLGRAEEIRRSVTDIFAAFLAAKYAEIAKDCVMAQPEVTKRLGVEGIRQLRARVKKLAGRAADIARHELGANGLWWHAEGKKEYPHGTPFERDGACKWHFRIAVRLALGQVATLLEESGFARWPRQTEKGPAEQPVYSSELPYPAELKNLGMEYDAVCAELTRIDGAIAELRQKSAAEQAADIWDAAEP